MTCRRLSLFLVVLLVASFSVWALPGVKKSAEKAVAPETPEVTIEEAVQQVQETLISASSETASDEELNQISQSLNGLLDLLNSSKFIMGADKIEKLGVGVENLRTDIEAQNALIEAQNNQINALKAEAMKTKFFADFGISAGVKGDTVKLGILGEMGMKFGSGLIVKTGVTWSAFDAKELIKVPTMSVEDISMSLAVGWQW